MLTVIIVFLLSLYILLRIFYWTPAANERKLSMQGRTIMMLAENRLVCSWDYAEGPGFWSAPSFSIASVDFTTNRRLSFFQIMAIIDGLECKVETVVFHRSQLTDVEISIVESSNFIGEVQIVDEQADGERTLA